MSQPPNIDGVLIQWGGRLFDPGDRIVKSKRPPKLGRLGACWRTVAVREPIEYTSDQREAFNVVLSMPRGTNSLARPLQGRPAPLARDI